MVLVVSNTEIQRRASALSSRADDGSWNQDGVSGHEEEDTLPTKCADRNEDLRLNHIEERQRGLFRFVFFFSVWATG